MMPKCFVVILITTLWSAAPLLPTSARAAEPKSLRVGVSPFMPFVIVEEKQQYHGFSIDLWAAVAHQLKLHHKFVHFPNVAEKLHALQTGGIDIAIGGITLTKKRERSFDFTHPTFKTSLDILIPTTQQFSLWKVLGSLAKKRNIYILVGFLALIIIAGHLMWLAERGRDSFSDKYIPGVFEGMYWAIVTASTVGYGDKAPVKWTGRILAGVVIVISLPLFCWFTAELASAFTLQAIQSDIRGIEDLHDRRVGVVQGTTSDDYMQNQPVTLKQYDSIHRAFTALIEREVDAVVGDAPNLKYLAKKRGQGRVSLVGNEFKHQNFALVLPEDSPLREQINQALLDLREKGVYESIYTAWFGEYE